LLAIVGEAGPACHNGTESCFDSETLFDGETK
jgi:phosphoribosyl-AMP cyclohydrolase